MSDYFLRQESDIYIYVHQITPLKKYCFRHEYNNYNGDVQRVYHRCNQGEKKKRRRRKFSSIRDKRKARGWVSRQHKDNSFRNTVQHMEECREGRQTHKSTSGLDM